MHAKASFIFWLTLSLYLITLFTVSYVGVYLTYIVIPILVISGLIMKCSTPKPEHKKMIEDGKSVVREVGKAAGEAMEHANNFLDDVNRSLETHNKINLLVRERTTAYREKIQSLKLDKISLESKLKYVDSNTEKLNINNKISNINNDIELNKKSIDQIKIACELEVKAP